MGWGPGWGAGKFSRLNCASPSELERISAPRPGNGKARQARKKKNRHGWPRLLHQAIRVSARCRLISLLLFFLFLSLSFTCVRRKMDWALGDGKGLIERRDKM